MSYSDIVKLVLSLSVLGLAVELQQLAVQAAAQTQVGFYDKSCANAESIVKAVVKVHAQSDITIAAGLVRLHFHDCFIRGCDASILISGPGTERTAGANLGLRGFEVVEDAKAQVEAVCPGIVSCADILALAAKDAIELSIGGPSWRVPLGRRDGRVSVASDASNMPSPLDSINTLKQKFVAKGLSIEDLVILNGAHTIGQTDCRFFSYRLYNYSTSGQADPSISPAFVGKLRELCPANGDGLARVALDTGSQTTFDTSFFKNVNQGFGVLESDQRLMSDTTTAAYVKKYGGLISGLLGIRFDLAFSSSMLKMGNIGVLTGSSGEIRKVCSAFN